MSDAAIRDDNPFLYDDPDELNSEPVSILPEGGISDYLRYYSGATPSYIFPKQMEYFVYTDEVQGIGECHILNRARPRRSLHALGPV